MKASIDSAELLYRAALELPPSDRERMLAAACRDNQELRAEIERRLSAETPSVRPVGSGLTQDYSQDGIDLSPRSQIGPYKLLEELGEGGFGVVWIAQQTSPVRRKVALKVIKLGMDTRQVIARFQAERQALALMDHPNIARVLDAGSTTAGRPYFVMELVKGLPITEYCDRRRLPVAERLELFQQVCRAVQHAHQKGIIHRDIKPNNVLVSIIDDEPQIKVIDFGIAKATNSEMTERTLFTELKQVIGTPVYMSPEQMERAGVDVDTRADIYSLGVLLYELLTGVTPFDLSRLKSASWTDLQRIICEEEPVTMSARVVQLAEQAATNRSTDLGRLRSALRGDLDWIVMKAMEKNRIRRYGTASELSEDIARHLRDAPVSASPPSSLYRFQKYARRYRVPLAVASIMLVGLLAALLLTTSFMFWALRERNRAQAAAVRAERFLKLAGSTFLGDDQRRDANRQWQREIAQLQETHAPDHPERVRRECQYITWLATQAVLNEKMELLTQSTVDIDELHARAKTVLGVNDPQFLSLADAHIRFAVASGSKTSKEIVGLYNDMVDSLENTRGPDDPVYQRMVLERAVAMLGAQAGRTLPRAEAIRILAESAANIGISLDARNLGSEGMLEIVRNGVDRLQQTDRLTKIQSFLEALMKRESGDGRREEEHRP